MNDQKNKNNLIVGIIRFYLCNIIVFVKITIGTNYDV